MPMGLSELKKSMLGFKASEDALTPLVAGAASDSKWKATLICH